MKENTKIFTINSTQLKLFAAFLMVLDHIHQMFIEFGAPMWLTYLGRLVFPIYLFTLVEGFQYTRNRKRYLMRLLYGGWGMTILTSVLQFLLPNENVILINNAFTTLFLTGVYIWIWDRLVDSIKDKDITKISTSILLAIVPILTTIPSLLIVSYTETLPLKITRVLITLSMLLPNILMVEGGFFMILLGVVFYIFRKNRWLQVFALLGLSVIVYLAGNPVQSFMAMAAFPILLYNGEKGKGLKNFFYIFYPAHLTILYIISTLISTFYK